MYKCGQKIQNSNFTIKIKRVEKVSLFFVPKVAIVTVLKTQTDYTLHYSMIEEW